MNLGQLQAEVLAHGFDSNIYGSRIINYLNDCQFRVARAVNYYENENTSVISTISGTASYPLPANWARIRDLSDLGRQTLLNEVSVRDIDQSTISNGAPNFYAMDGQNLTLYPTPDNIYNLQLRIWLLPNVLVNATDIPNIPSDWHYMLAEYAIARCYWGDDDSTMGTQWDNKFSGTLAQFTADVRFPSTDYPTQAKGMWENERDLGNRGWALWGWI